MGDKSDVSDGYHTFGELYNHRAVLTAAFMMESPEISWRSRKHHDGTMFDDETFIVGMELPSGQISYHYNMRHWNLFDGIQTLEYAPFYDGHTSADVLERITAYIGRS